MNITDGEAETPTPRAPARRSRLKRWLLWGSLTALVLFGLIQLVPYGHSKNPPVTKAAVWPNTQVQTIAERGCYDCHSNLTKRWWGTEVAPASWLAQSDVDGGRNILNFSEWDKPQAALDEVIEAVQGGGMPPFQYKIVHSDSRLDSTQRGQLVDGLTQLYAAEPPAGTKHGGG